MPFQKDQATFEKLLARALETPEIKKATASSALGIDFLGRQLSKRANKVWSSATEEFAMLARIEEEAKAAHAQFEKDLPRRSPLLRWLDEAIPTTLGFVVLAIMVAGVIGFFVGFKTSFGVFLLQPWFSIGISVIIILAIGSIIHGRLSFSHKRKLRLYEDDSAKVAAVQQLDEEQAKIQGLVEKALLDKGIKSELRAIINAEMKPRYALKLSVRTAPGLAEVFDPAYEIPTESKEDLIVLLEDMPGGSIGIAGPRGAGKSTLIWSLCRGVLTTLKNRPLYALMTSAPVKYDGRDFILHLFSSLCYKVLGRNPGDDMAEEEASNDLPSSPLRWLGSRASKETPIILLSVGVALLCVGMFWTWQLSKTPQSDRSNATSSVQSADKSTSPETDRSISTPSLASLLRATELKPSIFLIPAFLCFAAGYCLLVFREREKIRMAVRDERRRVKDHVEQETAKRIGPEVARSASKMLQEIRFQQSYSSGWSGSLKLPIGIEGSINSALSLAERQRTFPEIVEAYRGFVKLVTAKNSILIGVDELDKLESDEIAQQFLNEIKSIFAEVSN